MDGNSGDTGSPIMSLYVCQPRVMYKQITSLVKVVKCLHCFITECQNFKGIKVSLKYIPLLLIQ